ncbi:6-carboxytetrahydropterin synthase [Granulicella sibirica]|uniref:6-carboxy-5,6,7,8-tetrahydropterin synthase n=1 Tax=Granulicella sibirica TaxID=2479048 RepID=A0A4Q0SZ81_9BACT|nr:6-carboxytetrahydropterin synthase [Granulicella sibirica]RXH55320.1 6-pyruvoyl tetrahydrobiopterin synthase [Granulicella sibirica]
MIAHLNRRYHFSASHRLHAEAYSDEKNRAVFGKCNNPHGHGHNYVVQITVSGPVDPVTGMVCDLGELDGFAKAHLLDVFDHQNLNMLPAFRTLVPSTENLSIEVHRIFESFSHARLEGVRIEETANNSFEYAG